MAINETIATGKKYRVMKDTAQSLWERISFWTKASDVEFDDGTTAQTKTTALENKLNTLTTDIREIKLVSALPSDAAAHPNTLYLIAD